MEPQIIAIFTRAIGETLAQACQIEFTCSCHVFKTHFNIIPPFVPNSPNWCSAPEVFTFHTDIHIVVNCQRFS
jgi:hypothetical protein